MTTNTFEPTEVESIAWDEGRILFDVPYGDGIEVAEDFIAFVVDTVTVWVDFFRDCWFAGDHLGNVRAVIDITEDLGFPQVLEQNDYLPFGTRIQNPDLTCWMDNRWQYAGKEAQRFAPGGVFNQPSLSGSGSVDLGLLNFGARMYDPFTARWTAADPMASKYHGHSPFGYCGSNPENLADPTGMEVNIIGPLSENVLSQLQERFKNSLVLSLNENGALSYSLKGGVKLKGQAKLLTRIIDDTSITINIKTTGSDRTSTGNLMVGGAFMGNSFSGDKVVASQEINPYTLGKADSFTDTPGKMIMHELTEAYYGGVISKREGTSAPMATNKEQNDPSSIYYRAHNRATPQSRVEQIMYDKYGDITTEPHKAVSVDWFVVKNNKKQIIQSLR